MGQDVAISDRHAAALRKAQQMENGEHPIFDQQDMEELEEAGLVEAQPNGDYWPTDEGKRVLAELNSN